MEMDEELKSNISSADTWLRILLIIGFGILTSVVVMPVVWVLAGAQFLFSLITGQINGNLHRVHQSLVAWLAQVFSYMLYVSDRKPFPFSDLPETDQSPKQQRADTRRTPAKKAKNKAKPANETAEP